jgi:hypothetical protein
LQRFHLNDFIEQHHKWRENQQQRWDLYRASRIPVHLVMDADKHPLGFDWFVRFRTNREVSQWRRKYPFWVRHGGRQFDVNLQELLNVDRIILDYTGLLLAYELDLLPRIEQAFRQIVLPPSLLMLIEVEAQRTAEYQLSRMQAQQKIHNAIEGKRLKVIEETANPEAVHRFQTNNLEYKDALLFSLAEQRHALVLARHLLGEEERQYNLAEPLACLRVFPHEIVTALYRLGELPQHGFNEATTAWRDEPCREEVLEVLLEKRPPLITDQLTAELFADLELLDPLFRAFDVALPASVANSVRYVLQEHRFRQHASKWLDTLRRHVSSRLGTHYVFPAISLDIDPIDEVGTCAQSLREVFHIAEVEGIPMWIDDRWAQHYEKVGQAPIVSISAILAFLKTKGQLSEEEFCQAVLKLIERNALFLPIDPNVVVHFLRQAPVRQTGQLQETYELKTIRRYIAGVFASGTALNVSPLEPSVLPESSSCWYRHQAACRDILLKAWLAKDLSEEQKSAMSEWVIGRMWKGNEEVLSLLPRPFDFSEAAAFSQFLLLNTAFLIALQDLRNEHSAKSASGYLRWLYQRFLHPYWLVNPDVQELVIEKLIEFVTNMIEKENGHNRQMFLAGTAGLLAKAPSEFVRLFLQGERTRHLFKDYFGSVVKVTEEIEVPAEDWRQWVFESIDLGTDVSLRKTFEGHELLLQWHEEAPPFLWGLRFQWVSEQSGQRTHTQIEPFTKLHHPSASVRRQALSVLLPFLQVPLEKSAAFVEKIGDPSEWGSVAATIEATANSSWKYFWKRLAHLIQAQIETNISHIFPNGPELFTARFPLPPEVFNSSSTFCSAWQVLNQSRVDAEGLENFLSELLSFPFGEKISAFSIISILEEQERLTRPGVCHTIEKLIARSSNPVVLQNCLALLLFFRDNDPSGTDSIQILFRKLLDLGAEEDPTVHLAEYDLYIALLHFAWCRMEAQESFSRVSTHEKILWTYAYAGTFMDLLDRLREEQTFEIDRPALCRWLRTQSDPSSKRLFADMFHEQLEVTHPLQASHLRTVISGTFGVIAQHELTGFQEELFQRLINVTRIILQKQIPGTQEIFKCFSATKNFFDSPFDRNVLVRSAEILGKIGDAPFNGREEEDRHLIQFVKAFVPSSELAAMLRRVADQQVWQLNDIILLGLSLDEPLDVSLAELLQQAISSLDLSYWSGDREFTFGCIALARCANATADPVVQKKVLEKLTEAWLKLAQRPVQYSAILSASILTFTNGHDANPALTFYRWWAEAIEKMQRQLPEDIVESAIRLAWQLPAKHQDGLSKVKAKLLLL